MSVSVFLSLRAYLQNYPLDLHHIHRLVVLRYVMYFRFYGLRNICIKSSDRMQGCCVAKLTYAAPAWWGFTIADDIDIGSTVFAAVCASRAVRRPTAPQLIDDADDKLFNCVFNFNRCYLNVIALYTALELDFVIEHFLLIQVEGVLSTDFF